MSEHAPARLDRRVTRSIRSLPHRPAVDATLSGFSRVTDHANGWLLLGAAGAAVDQPRRGRWLQATATVVATEAASRAIKRRVGDRRPHLDGLPALARVPDPLSLPSSHTADAVAAITAFDGLLPTAGLRTLAAIQAASRPYLGVHYAGDVVAGVAVGATMSRLRGPIGRAVIAGMAIGHLVDRVLPRWCEPGTVGSVGNSGRLLSRRQRLSERSHQPSRAAVREAQPPHQGLIWPLLIPVLTDYGLPLGYMGDILAGGLILGWPAGRCRKPLIVSVDTCTATS
jgi:hypothetical protein